MKFENTEIWGFEHALRGMRNPMESWDKLDSEFSMAVTGENIYTIGKNDMQLAQSLIRAGSEHRKFMRQIFVSVDITAPLYWWKEFDTYKVGTVANSTSTMHKLASTPITLDCFETDDVEILEELNYEVSCWWSELVSWLEKLRQKYNETKDKKYWKELIRMLPESWLQKRTVTMNYENILSIVRHRKNHKLTEWSVAFINWARGLPYAQELIFIDEVKK